MEDEDRQKMAVEALVAEASRLGDAIAERHAAAERFIAVAGTLSGVGLTLGLKDQQWPILIGLPIGIAIILLYMIQIYTDAGMHSGYRQALESHLDGQLGSTVLVGQTKVVAPHAKRPSIRYTAVFILLAWVGTIVLGNYAVTKTVANDWEISVLAIYWILVALAGYIMYVAMRENMRAEETARGLAVTAWRKEFTD